MKSTPNTFRRVTNLVILAVLLVGMLLVPASNGVVATSKTAMQSVIVQGTNVEQVTQLVAKHNGQITSTLSIIKGVVANVPVDQLAALRAENGITQVTPNAKAEVTDYGIEAQAKDSPNKKDCKNPNTDYPNNVGANLVWDKNVIGQGVTVAVLDTGVAEHANLIKDLDGSRRDIIAWKDFIANKRNPVDPNGHGTHVAGIIANAAKGTDCDYEGVAPATRLVAVRVLDETGSGTYESVIQGIQWVVDHKDRYNIKVINLSLHAIVQSPYWADPLNQAVMQAWAHGITVVVAAGNEGPGPLTVSVPGNVPYVITVGAFTDNYTPNDWSDDYITPFSASGPTLDNFVKPDVVAPGAHIVSTMMSDSYIAKNHQANKILGNYFSMAGTSQSAAVVSGVVSLVLSRNRNLTPDQVKYRIMFTALPWINADGSDVPYSIWQQGTGRVNAFDAVFKKVNGEANKGLDIQADINGTTHYEGYSYFDTTTGLFRLKNEYGDILNTGLGAWSGGLGAWSGSHYGSWADGLGAWSGGLGAWSGGLGAWSGGLGAWSGGLGAWSGGLGAWSGGLGAWSGGYTTWVDGLGAWSGGLGAWSGGLGAWSGGLGAWSGSLYIDPAYVSTFASGASPSSSNTSTSLSQWIEEPKP